MSASTGLGRRQWLRLAAALAALGTLPRRSAIAAPPFAVTPGVPPLALLAGYPADASLVGARFLAERPEESTSARLAELLALPTPDLTAISADGVDAWIPTFVALHRADARAGRIVEFDGWPFSATELRLCAFVRLALTAPASNRESS